MAEETNQNEINSIIVEIRAGTGGEESGLFARDLFRMYSKFGQSQGWGQKVLNSNISELGGFKEIIFELIGKNVFDIMKYEGGVHRVQRIPKTEKSGRIHTSTTTVAILPKPKKTETNINPVDLKITTYKASGPGGQYVNKTESAVRILHIPTGIVVTSQSERNQMQNKENAMAILAARVLEKTEKEQKSQITGVRKEQIGWAKRAEKMRTYNFPQDRITDHRIGKSWHDIESIMNGKMDGIVRSFKKFEQGQKQK
ncbi:PCRF domain-containing protein [Patescibacteria group bacterium]|nr:PCRF domain-containing protein [Patescibacteria group bacterium]MBU4274809.1 PCRF domain-containing protein [Patescibacteria group bacterium]MBU4367775.1 PCRF domain-containing protein [Patescibacteria group bacterium]MBU4461465.1 PCRF domain-containing protein [Patescibacteria group bacterium]MCG2700403.1 PCRF domain-containing protein [Candidatus Parcubacteria bacterium]